MKDQSKFFSFLCSSNSQPTSEEEEEEEEEEVSPRTSTDTNYSPYMMSPWNPASSSPFVRSPWLQSSAAIAPLAEEEPSAGLLGSLVRQNGHLYSLATDGDLLYTGSDSKNIRVWKDRAEFSGFKSGSGLVKAIVLSGGKIFTGHQDGKIRVWRASHKEDPTQYRRVGSLPRLRDFLKSSINPSEYVEVTRRHRNSVWLRHFDAVSCLSLDADAGLLYSGSWDRTVKVWRVSDSRCLESVTAHDDAINSVAVGFGGLVFTGSADGAVKVWRREWNENGTTKHALVRVQMKRESAVTALAVSEAAGVVYCGTSDGLVNYWGLKGRGRGLVHGGVLRGHKLAVLCLATAGRSLIISGSADSSIRVWRRDTASGAHAKLSVLTGHVGPIRCLAVSDDVAGDGWLLYSGSLDKSVKVWRVPEKEPPPHVTRMPEDVTGGGDATEPGGREVQKYLDCSGGDV